MYDIVIIGNGPAGLSAAISARQRNQSVLVCANGNARGWLAKAERIDNYPGFFGQSGPALLSALEEHAKAMGALFQEGLVRQVLPMDEGFGVAVAQDYVEARRVIIATGAKQPRMLPGEEALLGRGVSYCATCDGMLYRQKRIAVLGQSVHAAEEANYLAGLADRVLYFGKTDGRLDSKIEHQQGDITQILGTDKIQGVVAGAKRYDVDGLFILRDAVGLTTLLTGLALDGTFIQVDRQMRTNIPGVFAAGDCTGHPLQVAKAVGEGCIAALSAAQS